MLDFTAIHGVIRGYMEKFDTAIANAEGNPRRAKVVADLVLFGINGLRFHHHEEDSEYWPALVAKGADQAALEPLAVEHRELDPLLDDGEARARRLRQAPADAAALAAVAELFPKIRDHVIAHLNEEEPIMFPMLRAHIADHEAHAMAKRAARQAPREGLPWLIGGITYGMTPAERENFMHAFPKPIAWLRPLILRRYRRNCAVIGVPVEFG